MQFSFSLARLSLILSALVLSANAAVYDARTPEGRCTCKIVDGEEISLCAEWYQIAGVLARFRPETIPHRLVLIVSTLSLSANAAVADRHCGRATCEIVDGEEMNTDDVKCMPRQ
ncbi:hypothetical protein C8R43DRAFT_960523 [Mycena crocata]|nr:hypothetical protein C8R43DRAFT_960523 [Mycena crocata]